MTIRYQGKGIQREATTVAAFLEKSGIAANGAVAELDGEIVAADAVAATPLREGAELNVFRIVAGG